MMNAELLPQNESDSNKNQKEFKKQESFFEVSSSSQHDDVLNESKRSSAAFLPTSHLSLTPVDAEHFK